jgi:hypothetical protein
MDADNLDNVMNRYTVLVSLLCLLSSGLPPAGSQEQENASLTRYDRLVAGALDNARHRMARASHLEAEAREFEGRKTRRWLTLMKSVKRNYRIAWLGLDRYREVDLSREVDRRYRKTLKKVRSHLIRTYQTLARGHALAGNLRKARRFFASLVRFDPAAAERLADAVEKRFASRRERKARRVRVRRNIRGGSRHRLTGYEIRWLARRGYLGRPKRKRPRRPPRVPRPHPPRPPRPRPDQL